MTIDRALEERIAAAVEGARSRASARLRGKSRFSSASTIFTPKGKISSTKGPSLSVRITFSDKKFEQFKESAEKKAKILISTYQSSEHDLFKMTPLKKVMLPFLNYNAYPKATDGVHFGEKYCHRVGRRNIYGLFAVMIKTIDRRGHRDHKD